MNGSGRRAAGVLEEVRAQQRAEVDVAERRRHLLVDDPHHLLGRHAVGGQRGDERAGGRADVDVELVDGAVDRQQVERAQGADLVDRAREAAAAEHERGLRAPRRRGAAAPFAAAAVELDDVVHRTGECRDRSGPPALVSYGGAPNSGVCSSSPSCSSRPRPPPRSTPTRSARASCARWRAAGSADRRLRREPRDGRRSSSRSAPTPARIPASVEKLFVTATALLRCGPDGRAVRPASSPPPSSTPTASLPGNVWLVGGGDPTLTDAKLLRARRRTCAATACARIRGGVRADDTLLRPPPRHAAHRLRARLRPRRAPRRAAPAAAASRPIPPRYVAKRFAKLVRAQGILRQRQHDEEPRAARRRLELGAVPSPPIADLVRATNVPSDNFLAEMLLKGLGAAFGGGSARRARARRSCADAARRSASRRGSSTAPASAGRTARPRARSCGSSSGWRTRRSPRPGGARSPSPAARARSPTACAAPPPPAAATSRRARSTASRTSRASATPPAASSASRG